MDGMSLLYGAGSAYLKGLGLDCRFCLLECCFGKVEEEGREKPCLFAIYTNPLLLSKRMKSDQALRLLVDWCQSHVEIQTEKQCTIQHYISQLLQAYRHPNLAEVTIK